MDQKITSEVKTKDPKRVEAGKKLAAISKAAKEKKMRERIEKENNNGGSYSFTNMLIPTISILIAGGSLYFAYYRSRTTDSKEKEEISELKKIETEITSGKRQKETPTNTLDKL